VVKRPNQAVLIEALDEFRDAMRLFIVRIMRRIWGKTIKNAIYESVSSQQASDFKTNLHNNDGSIESALDIRDFPDIIIENWQHVFRLRFRGDKRAHVKSLLYIIKHARDQVSHPPLDTDLDTEYTRVVLYHIIEVLDKIDAIEAKASVERLRDILRREQALAFLKNTGRLLKQKPEQSQTDVPPHPLPEDPLHFCYSL